MSRRLGPLFRALPAYLGGKRQLTPLMFGALAEVLPRDRWHDSVLLDPMCSGGAVAIHAKALGFEVHASDIARRGVLVAHALIENSSTRLTRTDGIALTLAGADAAAGARGGAITLALGAERAGWFGAVAAVARTEPEPRRSLLELVILKLLLRQFPLSLPSASDAPKAASGDFDEISPRRLAHYLRARPKPGPLLIQGAIQQVNEGVIPGVGRASQGDARDVIVRSGAAVVFLDPPYAATTGYERAYALVDELLTDPTPETVAPPGLDELLDACRNIETVVLSYGGPTLSLDELQQLVRRHRHVARAIEIPYPHLRSVATEEKNARNREFLVIATR